MSNTPKILAYFEMIPDPRTCRQEHKLIDLITIEILSKICGANGWEDMADFCAERKEWLETFLDLPGGVPSPDTFRRVISAIQPDAFLGSFLEWSASVANTPSKLVTIDGKTLKGTDVSKGSHCI